MIKKIALLFSCLALIVSTNLNANHLLGGEISWECIVSGPNSGKYIFTMKLYRKCGNTANLGPSEAIFSNSPAGNIIVSKKSTSDLSPSCYLGQEVDCYTLAKSTYAIEEYLYQSSPVTLNGVPPSSGWYFRWESCCRPTAPGSPIIDNLQPQSQSYRIESRMYPYQNQNANPCFDSSPQFAEYTSYVNCTGYKINYTTNPYDPDRDSLFSRLVAPMRTGGAAVTYAKDTNTSQVTPRANGGGFIVPAPGFSSDTPLPWSHINMDTNNRAAVMDPHTGTLNFLSHTRGTYVLAIETNAYRCGQLVATIVRDMPILLIDCPPLPPPMSSTKNMPPAAQFIYQGIPVGDHLKDTVYAGDLVEFEFEATDPGMLSGLVPQTLTVIPEGNYFGNHYSDSLNGCDQPPCATVDTSTGGYVSADSNWQATGNTTLRFRWQTDCSHLSTNSQCYRNEHTYYFPFAVWDDYCPVPAQNTYFASITVLPDTNTAGIIPIDSIQSTAATNILHWTSYSGTGFNNYYIYKSNPATQLFEPLASLSSVSTSSYTDVSATGISSYYISLDSPACLSTTIYNNVELSATQSITGDSILLSWNSPITPASLLPVKYYLYRGSGTANMNLFDSTTNVTAYTDTAIPCLDTIVYQVKAVINGQNFTSAWSDTFYLYNHFSYEPAINHALVDTAGKVSLEWQSFTGPVDHFNAYILYVSKDSLGPYTVIDTISGISDTNYIDSRNADTARIFYYVKVLGYSDCIGKDTTSMRSNIVGTLYMQIIDLGDGTLQLIWSPFYGKKTKSADGYYRISRRYASMPWTPIDSVTFGNELYIDSVVVCHENIYYMVEIDSLGTTTSVTDYINITDYSGPLFLQGDSVLVGPSSGVVYTWYLNGDPLTTAGNTNEYQPEENGDYHLTIIMLNGCTITTGTVTVDLPIGIGEVEPAATMTIYPNPHSGRFELALTPAFDDQISLELMNNSGKIVYRKSIEVKAGDVYREEIDIHEQAKGLYFLKATGSKLQFTRKVLQQ